MQVDLKHKDGIKLSEHSNSGLYRAVEEPDCFVIVPNKWSCQTHHHVILINDKGNIIDIDVNTLTCTYVKISDYQNLVLSIRS
jgi:hypothetical protein